MIFSRLVFIAFLGLVFPIPELSAASAPIQVWIASPWEVFPATPDGHIPEGPRAMQFHILENQSAVSALLVRNNGIVDLALYLQMMVSGPGGQNVGAAIQTARVAAWPASATVSMASPPVTPQLEPVDTTFLVPAGQQVHLWITVNSAGVKPGLYRGRGRLIFGELQELASFPVEVEITAKGQ